MATDDLYPFDPDWVLAPSACLREVMFERAEDEITLAVNACANGAEPEALDLLRSVLRKEPYGPDTAQVLEQATGIPHQFWLTFERIYREGLAAGKTDITTLEAGDG